jgi:hypothetical protein
MIAFDQSVASLPVDMPDAVEMWVISVVNLANDTPIRMRFVRDNCDRPVQPDALERRVQKGLGSFCIPSGCEVDHPLAGRASRSDVPREQSTLARRKCLCARFVNSEPNF